MSRIALCGGLYSNPFAFSAFLTDARERGAERLMCLGDIGGYGADPNGLWPLILDGGVECIAGNYDVAIGRGDPDCGCGYRDPVDNHYAQVMYEYTLAHTDRRFAAWMRTLPVEHREVVDGVDFHAVHGSPLEINDFWWESLTEEEHLHRVRESGADVIACTHSGIPWIAHRESALVVNVGVLGRPANNGRPEGYYALLDIIDGHAGGELVALSYDWRAHAEAIRRAGLPEPFAVTVETGWWTTCLEVLPPRERARGRYQIYRSALPERKQVTAPSPDPSDTTQRSEGLPVVELFGSELFPARLWILPTYRQEEAGREYCRSKDIGTELSSGFVAAVGDEAVESGFKEICFGVEELARASNPQDLLEVSASRIDTVVRLNGQSIESARLLREWNGRGSADCQRLIAECFLPVCSGARVEDVLGLLAQIQETSEATVRIYGYFPEAKGLHVAVAEAGLDPGEVLFSATYPDSTSFGGSQGADNDLSGPMDVLPELTITPDSVLWHPSAEETPRDTRMELLRHEGYPPKLSEVIETATERFLEFRRSDGTMAPLPRCVSYAPA